MTLLDPVNDPGGTDTVALRDVWRVRDELGQVRWAYIELRGGAPVITGYAQGPVRERRDDWAAGAAAGLACGAALGAAAGGLPGAVVGALLGLLLGVSGGRRG